MQIKLGHYLEEEALAFHGKRQDNGETRTYSNSLL